MDSRKIKRALQEGNLKYRIVTEILNLFGYSNRNIAGLEIKNKVYQYLDKNYSRKIGEFTACPGRVSSLSQRRTNGKKPEAECFIGH